MVAVACAMASLLTQPSAAREPCGRGRQRGRARVWASPAGATRRLGKGPGKGRTSGEGFGQGPVRTGKAQSCHSGRRGRAHQAHDDQCRENTHRRLRTSRRPKAPRKSGPADRVAPLRRTAPGGRLLPHLAAEVEPVPGALTPADRSWGRASTRTPNGPRRARSAASTPPTTAKTACCGVSPTSSSAGSKHPSAVEDSGCSPIRDRPAPSEPSGLRVERGLLVGMAQVG